MRGRDKNWKLVRYKGNGAVYAQCKCGWEFACGHIIPSEKFSPDRMYKYCPACGAKKKYMSDVKDSDKEWLDHEWEKWEKYYRKYDILP